MTDTPTMGSRLKALRKSRKLVQADVAEAVGISRTHLTEIENGKDPGYQTFCALADFFGVSLDFLQRGTGAPFAGADQSCQPPYTPEEFAMIELWREMNEDQRRTMISLMTQLVRTNAA